MNNERVGFHHLDGASGVIEPLEAAYLRGPEIRQQRNIRRVPAQFARQPPVVFALQRHTLRADAHRQAQRLRGFGEVTVDIARAPRAAGHGANQNRRFHHAAKQAGAEIDVVKREFRQGAVLKTPLLKAGANRLFSPLRVQNDIQMIVLALAQFLVLHSYSSNSHCRRHGARSAKHSQLFIKPGVHKTAGGCAA